MMNNRKLSRSTLRPLHSAGWEVSKVAKPALRASHLKSGRKLRAKLRQLGGGRRIEMKKEQVIEIITRAEDALNADIFVFSGPIEDEGFGRVTKEVAALTDRHPKAILILTTNGGLANVAYQIARLFQKLYAEFVVFTPSRCKSAGTLVVLGANKLVMDTFSELGPLDVQLLKQNEIGARKSGLLSRSAFEALADSSFELYERLMMNITMRSGGLVSFKLASDLSATMASSLLAPVYGQINPEVVGSEFRDLNVALEYGVRLVGYSGNADVTAVYKLVHEYPSHDFIIDEDEAKELFRSVENPTEELYQVVALLSDAIYDEARPPVIAALRKIRTDLERNDATDDHRAESSRSEGEGSSSGVAEDRSADRPSDREPGNEQASGSSTHQSTDVESTERDRGSNEDRSPAESPLRVVKQ